MYLLLLIAIVLLFVYMESRQRRLHDCATAIRSNGGSVYFPRALQDNIRNWWAGLDWNSDTFVMLGENINDEWVAERDFLNALSITILAVDGNYLDCSIINQLIRTHPLKRLSVGCQRNADTVADVLADESGLIGVSFHGSDLTDAGLRRLPLEQLQSLSIAESQVTPVALDELDRCRRLGWIDLDGNQLDSNVAGLLAKLPLLSSIVLSGRTVTDDHLRMVQAVEHLAELRLVATSVTSAGLSEFRRSKPGVSVYFVDDVRPCRQSPDHEVK